MVQIISGRGIDIATLVFTLSVGIAPGRWGFECALAAGHGDTPASMTRPPHETRGRPVPLPRERRTMQPIADVPTLFRSQRTIRTFTADMHGGATASSCSTVGSAEKAPRDTITDYGFVTVPSCVCYIPVLAYLVS